MSLVYRSNSRIKRKRHRSTKAEADARSESLLEIVSEMHPMTVRQVFYQATVHGWKLT
jgi:hypothetical protein